MATTVNDSERSYKNKDGQHGLMAFDPFNSNIKNLDLIPGDFLGFEGGGLVTCPIGGFLFGMMFVEYVDEIGRVDESRQYLYSPIVGTWFPAVVDEKTLATTTIDALHHQIHIGSFFNAYRADTLTTGDAIQIALTTPDTTEEIHLGWECDVGGECVLDVVEDVTSYTGGTAFIPVNRNRQSTHESECVCKVGSNGGLTDPLVLTGGTTINERKIGAGKAGASEGEARHEWILPRNMITVFQLTAVANNISCGFRLYWYEIEPNV